MSEDIEEAVESAPDKCAFHSDRDAWIRCTRCDRPICGDCSNPADVGQHCPRCAGPKGRKARIALAGKGRASMVLLVLTAVVFAADLVLKNRLTRYGASMPYAVLVEGEWWRVFTPVFLHLGFFHLALNMYALYAYGSELEETIGSLKFVVLYFVSDIAASAVSIGYPALIDPDSVLRKPGSVGASGAIFGVLGCWLVMLFRRRRSPHVSNLLTQIAVWVGINLAYGLYASGIDNLAHIGGLVSGGLIGYGYDWLAGGAPTVAGRRRTMLEWSGTALVLVLSSGLFIASYLRVSGCEANWAIGVFCG